MRTRPGRWVNFVGDALAVGEVGGGSAPEQFARARSIDGNAGASASVAVRIVVSAPEQAADEARLGLLETLGQQVRCVLDEMCDQLLD